jgi:cystathionine gamma-synthase
MNIETQAVHAGQQIDPSTGALTPPIQLSTTFERAEDGSYPGGYVYARSQNPNREALEASLAVLEGGTTAAAFASGSVATMTLLQALRPGDHLIAPLDLYYGIRVQLTEIFAPWGLETSFVEMTDTTAVQQAIRPHTRLILAETPSNPLIRISDIGALAQLAHQAGALLAVDNTMATPVLQRPLGLGADLVIQSTTKFLSGHADVTGGAVIASELSDYFKRIQRIQTVGGATPSPFDCWLTLRGIQSLPYRVQAQSDHALQIARYLANHPAIERVLYPGLPSHPGHEIARQQMTGYGGVMSVQVKGTRAEAMGVAARVKLFTRATSFGGTHSTLEHRASVEENSTTPENLLRISIGLEHVDDLIADLAQALG